MTFTNFCLDFNATCLTLLVSCIYFPQVTSSKHTVACVL